MRNPTTMMKSILTNERAQQVIDWVPPVYGNSYVALWIFQAMGIIMGDIRQLACDLRFETSPVTSVLLLDYWERHYNIPTDPTLTIEQRQLRLEAKTTTRGPCNPARLEMAVSSALGGVGVEITENVAKNTFLVNIREAVSDFTPAVAVLERMKPSHLIYQIRVATQTVAETEIKAAIAVVHAEMNKVDLGYDLPRVVTLTGQGVLCDSETPTLLSDGTLVPVQKS